MILCFTLLRLQANLSKELVTEKILLYNLPLINTSHTQMQFEVTIQDGTGSTTAMISDKIGEELLSLTVAAEIHEIRCIKKQLLPLIPVQHKLLRKTFTIQIKKLFAKHKDASSAKLFIMSITKEDIASNLPLPLTAPTTPESRKCKLKQIMTKED